MAQSKFQKIAVFVIIIGFSIYIGFQIFSSDFNRYGIETAENATLNDSINTSAYIFRNEIYVYNNSAGAISYELSDGEAVNKGGVIANIFSDESQAVAYRQTKDLKRSIETLSLINHDEGTVGTDLDTVNNSIESKIVNLLRNINSHSYIGISEFKSSLIGSINQRQYLIGAEENYDEQIAVLEGKLTQIESSIQTVGNVTAEESGYFVSRCDGYENAFPYSDVKNITADDLDSLKTVTVSGNCVGKIVKDFKWYIAAKVTAEEALALSRTDESLTVNLPFAMNKQIPAFIESINQKDKQSDGVVILSCNTLNSDLIQTRFEPMQINLHSVSGLRIPKKAIHDSIVDLKTENGETVSEKVQGVYILTGQRVDFKEIYVIYSANDFVLCDPNPDEGLLKTGSTVLLHDQIIVEGVDIYDGKIVE